MFVFQIAWDLVKILPRQDRTAHVPQPRLSMMSCQALCSYLFCLSASASTFPSVVALSGIHIPMMLSPSVVSCLSFLVLGHHHTLGNAQVAGAASLEAKPRKVSFTWLSCEGVLDGLKGELSKASCRLTLYSHVRLERMHLVLPGFSC